MKVTARTVVDVDVAQLIEGVVGGVVTGIEGDRSPRSLHLQGQRADVGPAHNNSNGEGEALRW